MFLQERDANQVCVVFVFRLNNTARFFTDTVVAPVFLSRCNISYLEEWLKDRKLQSSNAINTLRPLSQAAWLLQVNKTTEEDAKEIAEKCTELKPVQVVYSRHALYRIIKQFHT